jgi:hypothetical protein
MADGLTSRRPRHRRAVPGARRPYVKPKSRSHYDRLTTHTYSVNTLAMLTPADSTGGRDHRALGTEVPPGVITSPAEAHCQIGNADLGSFPSLADAGGVVDKCQVDEESKHESSKKTDPGLLAAWLSACVRDGGSGLRMTFTSIDAKHHAGRRAP